MSVFKHPDSTLMSRAVEKLPNGSQSTNTQNSTTTLHRDSKQHFLFTLQLNPVLARNASNRYITRAPLRPLMFHTGGHSDSLPPLVITRGITRKKNGCS